MVSRTARPRQRAATRGALRIGISGWRYPPWRGVFYPPKLPQRLELHYASRRMSSIELNGSFYSLQRPQSWAQWVADTPEDFVFSVKGPRYVTHMLKLRGTDAAVANFFASGVLRLGPKLGPILWQLPPQLPFRPELLDAFLRGLPRTTAQALALARGHDARLAGRAWLEIDESRPMRHAVEPRHPSFVDPAFPALLRAHKVALVVADTAGRWPLLEDVTADFVYIRLHGDEELYTSGYSDEALDAWAERVDAWGQGREPADARRCGPPAAAAAARDVYCYFDNDAKVKAPGDAIGLMRRLGVAPADGHA